MKLGVMGNGKKGHRLVGCFQRETTSREKRSKGHHWGQAGGFTPGEGGSQKVKDSGIKKGYPLFIKQGS